MNITLTDIIGLIIILAVLGVIIYFTIKSKKGKGKCCGCPYAKQCTKSSEGCNKNKKH